MAFWRNERLDFSTVCPGFRVTATPKSEPVLKVQLDRAASGADLEQLASEFTQDRILRPFSAARLNCVHDHDYENCDPRCHQQKPEKGKHQEERNRRVAS